MMVESELRGADRLQHRIAQALAIVDLFAVRGFEQQAAELEDLQEYAVACLDRMIVDMRRVGKVPARRRLFRYRLLIACQGR